MECRCCRCTAPAVAMAVLLPPHSKQTGAADPPFLYYAGRHPATIRLVHQLTWPQRECPADGIFDTRGRFIRPDLAVPSHTKKRDETIHGSTCDSLSTIDSGLDRGQRLRGGERQTRDGAARKHIVMVSRCGERDTPVSCLEPGVGHLLYLDAYSHRLLGILLSAHHLFIA